MNSVTYLEVNSVGEDVGNGTFDGAIGLIQQDVIIESALEPEDYLFL